jgi:gliding motility-associated-like protein
MKVTYLVFIFFFSLSILSQEKCNNGIDDDGDGKIDLNDSDCICDTTSVRSIIPNHSFEEFDDCPYTYPQNYITATSWIQVNNSRVNYINCGIDLLKNEIFKSGLMPYPDGSGIIGSLFTGNKKGYVGTCLLSPMIAGEEYQLTLDVAALIVSGIAGLGDPTKNTGVKIEDNPSLENELDLDPINITLYGSNSCSNLPLTSDIYYNIFQSPPTYGPKWIEIGSATYTPASKWGKLTITFIPTIDIEAIIIGSPQKLPLSYPYVPSRGPYKAPMFLFDNLVLNKSTLFGVNIKRSGAFCENNLVLTANPTIKVSLNIQYQWYKEGIAIQGATNPNISIPNNIINFGNYIIKITDNLSCILSSPYNVNNTIPEPSISIIQPTCTVNTGTITITSPAKEYSFDNGKTWTANNTATLLTPKTYFIKIRNIANCEAAKLVVINDLIKFPAIYIVSPITYQQNAISKELTAGGTNLLWYTSESGGIGSAIAPTPQTTILGSTNYYVSQTLNGCEDSNRKKITVDVIPIPYSFNYPHYFTPNGDGINDIWNINDFVKQNEAMIYIYDKYGKLLKLITPDDFGWDGKYNGIELPSSDYWFKAVYKENGKIAEFKSHFTLKR